ncbi:MAG: 4-hydroxy-3-methylbut-2-enyl diphosphate reductase [Nitrospirae bacterium]|nr:4-hydroxy-3-methylbut-2-enyl diphosphate reductase [Nitrospirota bacterium]
MQIIVAKKAGFCFGVKRAIDITFALAKDTAGTYTLGPLIHNPHVINKLISQGVAPTEDVQSQKIKTLIIRTHGISPQLYEKISKIGYKIVDATCPFVKKAQKFAQTLKEEGYQVLIVGDKEHPEVQALLGFAGDNVLVVNSSNPLPPFKNRVGIIVQTTQPFEALKKIVSGVLGIAKEVKVYNTICNSTSQRLEETKNLAKEVDAMIIVGGKNSANTTQLARLSAEICAKVYFIEDAGELREEWFKGVKKVGVTGGASTPAWIIDRVVAKLSEISVKT